jgi:hypothetical protein
MVLFLRNTGLQDVLELEPANSLPIRTSFGSDVTTVANGAMDQSSEQYGTVIALFRPLPMCGAGLTHQLPTLTSAVQSNYTSLL